MRSSSASVGLCPQLRKAIDTKAITKTVVMTTSDVDFFSDIPFP